MSAYTHKRLTDVEDSAAGLGLGPEQESRFATGDFAAEETGFALHRFRAGTRQAIGHRHEQAEEVYVVVAGSGRMKLDDDIIEIERMDAVRVAPSVMRSFEAGPDGLDILVFGRQHDGDGEAIPGWWSD